MPTLRDILPHEWLLPANAMSFKILASAMDHEEALLIRGSAGTTINLQEYLLLLRHVMELKRRPLTMTELLAVGTTLVSKQVAVQVLDDEVWVFTDEGDFYDRLIGEISLMTDDLSVGTMF